MGGWSIKAHGGPTRSPSSSVPLDDDALLDAAAREAVTRAFYADRRGSPRRRRPGGPERTTPRLRLDNVVEQLDHGTGRDGRRGARRLGPPRHGRLVIREHGGRAFLVKTGGR